MIKLISTLNSSTNKKTNTFNIMSDLSFLQKYTQTNMTLGINITQIQRNKLTKSGTHQLYRKSLSPWE